MTTVNRADYLSFDGSDGGESGISANDKLLHQFGRSGAYILTEDTQNEITKLHRQRYNQFRSAPLTKFVKRRLHEQPVRYLHDMPYQPDINSEASRRLLDQLRPDFPLLDIQRVMKPSHLKLKMAAKPPKRIRKHTTRTAPSTGFKSLYQLSLMLGKGFNIDDLYLVQDSFSKENLRARTEAGFGPLPFSTVNPPVTVVPLKPQLPSTRFEPLPVDYVATVRPLRKEAKEMFNLQDSYKDDELGPSKHPMKTLMRNIIKAIDPELARIDSDVTELRKVISSRLTAPQRPPEWDGNKRAPSSGDSTKADSSTRRRWFGSSSSNSISSMSKCGLLRKDVYDLSDEESTPDDSENEGVLADDDDEMTSELEEPRFEEKMKGVREEVVMFSYKNAASSLKAPCCSNELPSSRESTKANASLTSRVDLEDVSSEERSEHGQMQSSERAHPLCNTVTPGTVMRTYEQAIGKDVAKGAQRSHTFSGLEARNKKGKDRLAISFPTIFQHNN